MLGPLRLKGEQVLTYEVKSEEEENSETARPDFVTDLQAVHAAWEDGQEPAPEPTAPPHSPVRVKFHNTPKSSRCRACGTVVSGARVVLRILTYLLSTQRLRREALEVFARLLDLYLPGLLRTQRYAVHLAAAAFFFQNLPLSDYIASTLAYITQ